MDAWKTSKFVSFAALFASGATLLCCALPALFVVLGAGAAWAGLMGNFPGLIWLSEHKGVTFSAAAVLLTVAGALIWHARSMPCPADVVLAAACTGTRGWSQLVYLIAVSFLLIGGFFAYAAPYFF